MTFEVLTRVPLISMFSLVSFRFSEKMESVSMKDANGGGGAESDGAPMLLKVAHTDPPPQPSPSAPPSSMEQYSSEEPGGDKSQSEKVRSGCLLYQ